MGNGIDKARWKALADEAGVPWKDD